MQSGRRGGTGHLVRRQLEVKAHESRNRALGRASRARDDGAATIYATAVGLTLVMAGLAVAVQGMRVVAAEQARTAADLGALAGATRAAWGQSMACLKAEAIVAANAATMVDCWLDVLDLTVKAEFRGATATARAGPIRSGN